MNRSRYLLIGAALAAAAVPMPTFADDDEPNLKPIRHGCDAPIPMRSPR